ncbi:bifunctional diaminohydroxyphosphoribosylaminopyrimidine deaminase/5-amino-6-(5-phosphoribosylamino)uracil reductase RibD [Duncaniella freteri]|mgnify:FL=1|uniref:Riboflavin biosynthesis protein RibD n=22 Tax=Duncaniella TaxID=2518495 RepID=A0A4Z0V2T0_9BACT|nr:bifunctional diaminohydroxyphosphoribosylaminopyrimidine deaminase/5-amino-6-(5-phosphoribosylamino)uracil reductase RibD [Duncaniella freteri]TGG36710.1 bifunctional diaminohydroxyphosphoribosylaminopyrimidine deaminase/5-amino-6-(5-phosphoribosylamino)uracil reductase RibD [Duncaniella freteri]
MEVDERYMRRALCLAGNGLLDASPNPMVGAVLVDPSGKIIGEGWHRRCGEGHAEVNAVASVADTSLLRNATMYVTLEPCSHYGKTPPCASLIIEKGIPRVVIGCLDPFEKVAGRGVRMLKDAGVEVVTGCLEKECLELNEKFVTSHRRKRPFVTLKWAESADGYIDGKISTPLTSMLTHRLRATHDAILVGSGTVLADNPRLDTRLYAGHSPLRVILDRRGRVMDAVDGTTIIYREFSSLNDVLEDLYKRGITSVLVEGGAELHRSFIDSGLWDAMRIERGCKNINGKVKAPCLSSDCEVESVDIVDMNRIINIKNVNTLI